MNKIAKYLNEHILGETIDNTSLKQDMISDGSIMSITPDIIVSPRTTNDIRKINRFAWQLAEKGHIIPITTRGGGTDQTGAAIGKGIIINTMAHLNKIIFINSKDKDKFVHTQPGLNFKTLNEALKQQGFFIPSFPSSYSYSTIGGAIANHANGSLAGSYNRLGDDVIRLEVILANGDVIETGRLSRHELNKKKGLQTLEGEIYRRVDGLIEDNQQLINDLGQKPNNLGYAGIQYVKQKNGSFDLTPLFVGSQGTLGVISEMIIKLHFHSNGQSILVIPFEDRDKAFSFIDSIKKLKPTILEYIDGSFIDIAHKYGKKYAFDKLDNKIKPTAIAYISFNDFNQKARQHKIKNIKKQLAKQNISSLSNDDFMDEELLAIREISSITLIPENKAESMPSLIDGASVPTDKISEFSISFKALADKHHLELPLHLNCLNGVIHSRCPLQMQSVGDKQRSLKLINDYADLIEKFGGCLCTESAEGRLKTIAAYSKIDANLFNLYKDIKKTFDPFNIMNPGVKEDIDIRTVITALDPNYSLDKFIKYGPRF